MSNFGDKVYDCPIQGWNLVEANAGTGKTYQIQNLFARCIMEKGWCIDAILVVTFTEAATEELRERLQQILNDCISRLDLHADSGEPSVIEGDPETDQVGQVIDRVVANLLEAQKTLSRLEARALCRIRARAAVLDFDNNAISTIHGFCSRMLGEAAFECGADFDAELVTDKTQLLHEVVRDVWRQFVLPLAGTEAELAADKLKFDDVVRLVSSVLNKPKVKVLPALQGQAPSRDKQKAMTAFRQRLDANYDALVGVVRTTHMDHCPVDVADALKAKLIDLVDACREAVCLAVETGGEDAFTAAVRAIGKLEKKGVESASVYKEPWVDHADDELDAILANYRTWAAWYGENIQSMTPKSGIRVKAETDTDAAMAYLTNVWKESKCALSVLDDYFARNEASLNKAPWNYIYGRIAKLAGASPLGATSFDIIKKAIKGPGKSLEELKRRLDRKWTLPPEMEAFCDFFKYGISTDETWLLWLTRQIVERSRKRFDAVKRSRNLMTYDDLLLRLHDALTETATSGLLKRAIKTRYKIAVIDEFQDTDPVQYGVFEKGFRENKLPVFVVGDPKQAIYAFRSGDLATFFAARDNAPQECRFGLTTNWRSQPGMVDAFNELFTEAEGDPAMNTVNRAFATGEMTYAASGAAKKAAKHDPRKPLVVELHEINGDKDAGRKKAAASTAARIAYLLRERNVKLGSSSIAVLVSTHAEARLVKEELSALEPPIAAVLQSSGKIFESEQATDFRFILKAMLEPQDVSAVRAAMATPVLDGAPNDLLVDVGDAWVASGKVQNTCSDFLEAHNVWKKHGLVVAFNRLAVAQRIRQRQLGLADGERRWTNLLQVAELLDRAAREQKLGMHAVARWLDRQLDGAEQDDAYEIRLESDDRAVEIMTVFKSKGLQRDYLFVPFAWAKTPTVINFTKLLEYHEGRELILNLDVKGLLHASPTENPAIAGHEQEKLQEFLRLLYVAVTRAKHEAHLIHVNTGKESRNALSYLLTNENPPRAPIMRNWRPDGAVPVPDPNKSHYEVIDQDEAATRYAITIGAASEQNEDEDHPVSELKSKAFAGRIDRTWQILSFSKLAGHGGGMDAHDFDPERSEAVVAEERLRFRKEVNSLFAFKAGAVTGNCWHEIFEHLDFKTDKGTIVEIVEKWATLYRLVGPAENSSEEREAKLRTLVGMVDATLDLPLPLDAGALRQVPWANRLAEMQFHFPVNAAGVSRAKIAQVLANKTYGWDKGEHPSIKAVLDKWQQPPASNDNDDEDEEHDHLGLRGFMTGFIDLTFRATDKDGHVRYYLLDWKSNQVDGTYEGFTKEALIGEMAHARYFLQYLLYAAALHQYLKANLKDYSYANNFGGVFYVFLRGVCEPPADLWQGGEWNAVERSVYDDKPPESVLDALWDLLSGGGS